MAHKIGEFYLVNAYWSSYIPRRGLYDESGVDIDVGRIDPTFLRDCKQEDHLTCAIQRKSSESARHLHKSFGVPLSKKRVQKVSIRSHITLCVSGPG